MKKKPYAKYGARLKRLRKSRGLSQNEQAWRIGIGESTMANWERGVRLPAKQYAVAVAEFYGENPWEEIMETLQVDARPRTLQPENRSQPMQIKPAASFHGVVLGSMVTREPEASAWLDGRETNKRKQPMTGRVVYLHPKGRFHVVEFKGKNGGTFRESFWGC